VPLELLSLLAGKDVLLGAIDVATDAVETAKEVAAVIGEALRYVPRECIIPCTNCGMAPMRRDIATAKLTALGAGAKLTRERSG
jgi:5-methyltetrahydropteroyltriglutamate--homocysteine methyltransferase